MRLHKHAMAQVKALRLSNYCRSISSVHYHLSELIKIAQPPYLNKDHAMAQVKALRLSNYCRSISSVHYHLSELIKIVQPPYNFSILRVYKIMSHRGAINHFHHNRISTKSLWDNELAHN